MLKIVETLQTNKEAAELETRAQKYVETRLNAYISIQEFQKEKTELNQHFTDIEKTLTGSKKKFDSIDADLS